MSLPNVHVLAIDSFAVLLSATFLETFTTDEQAIIGAFFTVLGDLIALNSAYLAFQNSSIEDSKNIDEIELLKKSIDKIQEEIKKV